MPIKVSAIAVRSRNERGRNAERIPTGGPAVTGAALSTISLTLRRVIHELPRSRSPTSRQRKRAYCMGSGLSVPRKRSRRSMSSCVACAGSPRVAGLPGMTQKVTNVKIVTAMNIATAQRIRLAR